MDSGGPCLTCRAELVSLLAPKKKTTSLVFVVRRARSKANSKGTNSADRESKLMKASHDRTTLCFRFHSPFASAADKLRERGSVNTRRRIPASNFASNVSRVSMTTSINLLPALAHFDARVQIRETRTRKVRGLVTHPRRRQCFES